EECVAVTSKSGGQSVLFPWRTVVVPPYAEVESQTAADFPIVFEEDAPFVLMNIANLTRLLHRIAPFLLGRIGTGDETVLTHPADGPGKENKQVLHAVLVSRRGVARQSWDVAAVDSGNRSQLCLSAVNPGNGVHVIKSSARTRIACPCAFRAC